MSETNPKDGLSAHQASDIVDRVGTRFGIAGAVGKKHAVGFQREHIFRGSLRRNHGNFAAFATQLAKNILLDAVVVRDHMEALGLVFYADHCAWLVRALADIPYIGMFRSHDLR